MNANELYSLLQGLGILKLKITRNNIMGCCPSHNETRPSWGISLDEPHPFCCFGCGFKGTLFSLLLAYDYPLNSVLTLCNAPELHRSFKIDDPFEKKVLKIDESVLWQFSASFRSSNYILRRGVSLATIMNVRPLFDPQQERVIFLWWLDKELVGCTGRTLVNDPQKIAAYGGMQKSELLYSPSRTLKYKSLIIVEGEIDALKVYSAGFKNVAALGFGNFTAAQKKLILKNGVEEVVIFTDNDERGRELSVKITEAFDGGIKLKLVEYPLGFKDPADMTSAALQDVIKNAEPDLSWCTL